MLKVHLYPYFYCDYNIQLLYIENIYFVGIIILFTSFFKQYII